MNYIDLFAGAGGLSEGFMRTGYNAIAHIEMNADAVNTLKTRRCYYYLSAQGQLSDYYRYMRGEIDRDTLYGRVPKTVLASALNYTMSEQNIEVVFARVDELMALKGETHIDVIVGGPPCQSYSLANRAADKEIPQATENETADERKLREKLEKKREEHRKKEELRKNLYRLYCRFLQRYTPDMFVFENVPGLISSDGGVHYREIQAQFKQAGYDIDPKELNAKNFGVLQNRKRIVIIGWRREIKHLYPAFEPLETTYTVQDVLSDLPSIQAGTESNRYRKIEPSQYVSKYLRTSDDVLTYHVARPHIERDKSIYRLAIKAWNNGQQRIKYTDLPEELCTHKNREAFLDRFKVVASDLPYCHTVMAHISKDGHYFIHPDIKQARSLTVREAARLQSFPDNYYFEGSRTAVFTQIGNAVPPIMAEAIAKALRRQLEG